jgi:UDP-N-acetylmuramoyl-L-alanyl-D-glutamate--2,6-diaminopimelate ligase
MGAAAAAHADLVFVTDDNPRSEDPATIRAAVLGGAIAQEQFTPSTPGRIREIGDRAIAIREAVAHAGVGDTVVVLGKGHESGQDIAGVVHPFDDRTHLKAALMERAASLENTVGHPDTDAILGEAQ